jgi:hypothetical protein
MAGSGSTRRASARAAVLLCATLGLGALAPGAAASGASRPATSSGAPALGAASQDDIAAAVAFRTKLGLRADRAFVAATFRDPAFSSGRWGVPVDSTEAADLGRRAALQAQAAVALRRWSGEAESAGAYLDQHAKGAPVFLTTGDPARAKGLLGKLLPTGANARFVRVRFSMTELLAVQSRLNSDLRGGVLAGLGVVSTSIDARANAVAVGVSADSDAVRAELGKRYGGAVRPRVELPAQGGDAGCTSRTSCPPAKGGIEIVSSYNGNNCTIGFLVRVQSSPDPRILTAGHCIAKSGGTGTSRTWSHNGTSMGWAELGYWTDGADADVGLINPASGAISGARNLLYGSSSSNIVSVSGYRANAEQVQGSLVCRSAVVSGYHCGTIELTNRTKDVDGHTIDHQWVVDFDGCPGDSGGPYYAGSIAYGIHTDSTVGCDPSTNEAWYSPIGWVLDVLAARGHPVSLCVSSSCGSDTGVWTTRGALNQATWEAPLIALKDGRVLEVGGESGALLASASSSGGGRVPEVFDPSTGLWTDAATPPWSPAQCDGQFAVRLQSGRVLVGGGHLVGAGAADACDGAHVYDPASGAKGAWTTVAAPPAVLDSAGAALLGDGRAFVTGGSGPSGSTSVAMAYSPTDDAWSTLAAAPSGALDPLVLPLGDGRVLVSGGYLIADAAAPGYTDVTATRLYDPGTDAWTSTTAVGARGSAGVVLSDGRAVVAGGQHLTWNGSQGSSFSNAVARFDPATSSWTSLSPMSTARAGFTLAELPNGIVLAAGGRVSGSSAAGVPTKAVEGWDPSTKAWYAAAAMQAARGDQGNAMLATGALLVAGGGTASSETYIAADVVPPTAAAPAAALRSGVTMSTGNVPVRVSWSAADTGGSGVGTYDLARSTDGGAYTTIATRLTSTSYDTTTSRTHTYRFEVRARDWAGNLGPWKAASTVRINVLQESSGSIHYSGTWKSAANTSYSGGSLRYATASGASASSTFTGRSVAFVSSRGPTRGSAKVYIDGVLAATVNLNAATLTYRYVAFQKTWTSSGSHTIKVVVLGSSGHPRVDLDALETISNP